MTTFAPRTTDEVIEAIRWALAGGEALEVMGTGSRRALGRPVHAANVLDVSGLSGIVSYEPAELVLTARAGTPMHVIEAALAEHSQCLAFEPPDLAGLLSSASNPDAARASVSGAPATASSAVASGTLGGVVAAGLSGPRRFKAGAVRDHVLGISAVSGRGEVFVGGGKVVKNVTGYDIPKLMTGSYGTLAVLSEITVKVLPAPQDVSTVVVAGLGVEDAVRAMTGVLQSSLDVSGACHLPAGIVVAGIAAEVSITAFRLEGFPQSVEFRQRALCERLTSLGPLNELKGEASSALWRVVRDVTPFARESSAVSGSDRHHSSFDADSSLVWRISIPPAAAADVVERIRRALPDARFFLDWGGGLIWLALPAGHHHPASAGSSHGVASHGVTGHAVREALGDTGGHATLIRAPALVRANVNVFQPQSAAVAALSKRVKKQFDPSGVLNPGRMYADV